MTNHNPTITSSAVNDSFSEDANTTDSTALHHLSGTMDFKDSDKTDTHTTSAALTKTVVSGGTVVPSTSLTDLEHALTSTIASDSNGSGVLDWAFNAPDDDFDFLSKGQTLALTYTITVADNHGGSAKQTVNITITGSDDKPIVTMSAGATVTEQPHTTLSLSPDVAHPTVQFIDPDLANVGYTAAVVGVSASGVTTGVLPGILGTIELSAFFHIDSVVKAAGSSTGVINTTFAAPDLAFDYLAAGEQLIITYAVQLNDGSGGTTTQNVNVTVVGTNDAPFYLSGPESAHLTEGQNLSSGNLAASGELFFTDVDLSDTHTVSDTVTASRSGGGAVPLSNATLLAALSTSLDDSTGHLLGDVDWAFSLPNSDVNFLSGGETLTLTYDISVTDPSHATATQVVTVTVLGVNHPVVITSGPESASVSELPDTTGSATLDTAPTGTIAFTDQDISDTHTVAVSVGSTTWSGGSAIPATTLTDLTNALATTLSDSTGTGSGGVNWTFSIPDSDLDFLAAGETLTTVYDVKVSDASTSATQTVTVTAVGANDDVTITSGPDSGTVAELPNTTGSSTPDTSSPGTLSFTDADLNDTHQFAVSLDSAVWSVNPSFVPQQTLTDLQSALATTLNDSTGTGSGSVNWSFSIPDEDLDFLGAGETLTAAYDVTVSDAGSSSTQNVVITMTGAEDPLVVNPVTDAVADTANMDAGNVVAVGDLISAGFDTAGDASTTLSVTAVNGQAANVDSFVAGTYGNLFVDASGFYFYVANPSIDPLQIGDNPTDQFNFTVTDSLGRSESTTLTFDVAGADDAPIITSADTIGSMTEDAGPTILVNGGFETGDLTGWTASDPEISAEFLGLGGAFGNYAAMLAPSNSPQSLSQEVSTAPGQQYTLSFVIDGDPDASSSPLTVTWDGATILSLAQVPVGFTQYTLSVTGDAFGGTTPLSFNYSDDGSGILLDQVAVNPVTGPATESAQGTINFSDVETGDTHAASFQPDGNGYLGTFSLDPVSEVSGTGSVGWHFSVDNSAIQFLSQGQTLTQDYTVTIADEDGASVSQDVTIAINGSNDPPAANPDTVITDVDTSGISFIPGWALTRNDTDPDIDDTVTVNSVDSSSGGTAIASPPNGIFFFEDSTLGGQFSYDVTDGIATSAPASVIFDNNPSTSSTLTGTSEDDIIIGDNTGETLDGGAGNDILIGNAGGQMMTGGTGNDIFGFEQALSSPSIIVDFNNTTEQDQIAFSAGGFGGGLTPGMDTSAVFESSGDNMFASTDSRFHLDTANQTLYFSADGTSASEVALVQLQNGATLHPSDLLIVR